MKATGYSLWLIPTGDTYTKLSNLIKQLAEEYSGPFFQPHITLLSEVTQSEQEVIEKTRRLASFQDPFLVTLATVNYQDYYFKSLFVKAKKDQNLINFHNHAERMFDQQSLSEYMPHLSLLYGNFPNDVKNKIIEAIGRNLTITFVVESIHIFMTEGEANNWYRIGEFVLQK